MRRVRLSRRKSEVPPQELDRGVALVVSHDEQRREAEEHRLDLPADVDQAPGVVIANAGQVRVGDVRDCREQRMTYPESSTQKRLWAPLDRRAARTDRTAASATGAR